MDQHRHPERPRGQELALTFTHFLHHDAGPERIHEDTTELWTRTARQKLFVCHTSAVHNAISARCSLRDIQEPKPSDSFEAVRGNSEPTSSCQAAVCVLMRRLGNATDVPTTASHDGKHFH